MKNNELKSIDNWRLRESG